MKTDRTFLSFNRTVFQCIVVVLALLNVVSVGVESVDSIFHASSESHSHRLVDELSLADHGHSEDQADHEGSDHCHGHCVHLALLPTAEYLAERKTRHSYDQPMQTILSVDLRSIYRPPIS